LQKDWGNLPGRGRLGEKKVIKNNKNIRKVLGESWGGVGRKKEKKGNERLLNS